MVQFVLGISILLGVLARFVFVISSNFSVGRPNKFFVQAPIAHKSFFWMQILVKGFSNDCVSVDTNAHLFEHGVDVCALFLFTAFIHHDHASSSFLNVLANVLKLLSIEGQLWTSKQQQMAFLKFL